MPAADALAVAEPRPPVVDPELLSAYFERERRHWGNLVRQRREDLGLTQQAVAELAGTTAQTVNKVETGAISPRDHLRLALAIALSTEIDRLFPIPSRATVLKELHV